MIKKTLDKFYYVCELICHRVSIFSKIYVKFHEDSVKKEIQMAQITKSDKILHMGCGAIPYTAIIINKEIKANVVGIDNRKRIIDYANKFVERYFPSNNSIKFEFADGKKYNITDFDVILISYGITNQEQVLENVIKNIKKDARVIIRCSTTEKNEHVDLLVQRHKVSGKVLLFTQKSILLKK